MLISKISTESLIVQIQEVELVRHSCPFGLLLGDEAWRAACALGRVSIPLPVAGTLVRADRLETGRILGRLGCRWRGRSRRRTPPWSRPLVVAAVPCHITDKLPREIFLSGKFRTKVLATSLTPMDIRLLAAKGGPRRSWWYCVG